MGFAPVGARCLAAGGARRSANEKSISAIRRVRLIDIPLAGFSFVVSTYKHFVRNHSLAQLVSVNSIELISWRHTWISCSADLFDLIQSRLGLAD